MMMTKLDSTTADGGTNENVPNTHRMIMQYQEQQQDEKIELHAQTLEEQKTVITNVATKQIVIIFWHMIISNTICAMPLLVKPLGTESRTFGVLAVILQSLLLYLIFPFGNNIYQRIFSKHRKKVLNYVQQSVTQTKLSKIIPEI